MWANEAMGARAIGSLNPPGMLEMAALKSSFKRLRAILAMRPASQGASPDVSKKKAAPLRICSRDALRFDLGGMRLTEASRRSPAGELLLKRESTEIFVRSLAAPARHR
jgi:hypothetical protein